MIKSTTTTATTGKTAAANGDIPLIAVNGTPFMTPVVTPTNSQFVAPRMNQTVSHDISLTDIQAAFDQNE